MKYRIKNALKLFFWALKNPETLNHSHFKLASDMLGLVLKVANEDRHYMTHIAYVHPDEGEKQICSIWAGAGMGSSPTKRIAELQDEIAKLKGRLNTEIEFHNIPTKD